MCAKQSDNSKAAGTISAHLAINPGNKSPNSCKAPPPHPSWHLPRAEQPEKMWLPGARGTVLSLTMLRLLRL